MDAAYDGRQIVGIDLHRNRSVIVRMTDTGEHLGTTRIDNNPYALAEQMTSWGESPNNPRSCWRPPTAGTGPSTCSTSTAPRPTWPTRLGVKGFSYRRVKNDKIDAGDLADLLRMGRLPEAWIAPPATRELRELVRHRAKLVALRSGLKAGVHAVLAKCGVHVPMSDLFGPGGTQLLDELRLPAAYAARIASLRRLIDAFDFEIVLYAKLTATALNADPGWRTLQTIDGVGPIFASVFVAEIGDVTRFGGPAQLCSWAGLTPRHRESDTKVHRGRITKQGSTLVRWAAVEAVQRIHRGPLASTRVRVGTRRGTNIGKVAAARKLLTLVYYGLRDGHIRCLAKATA